MQVLEQIPDSIKVVGTMSAPALTFMGFPVQEWGYLISAIVGLLFIVEKIPVAAKSLRTVIDWIKSVKRKK